MRAIALFALLACLPFSANAQSNVQVDYKSYPDSTSCSFKDHRRMTLVDAPPALPGSKERSQIGLWTDSTPTRAQGPIATLEFTFMRPGAGETPWLILPSISYAPDQGVARDGATQARFWIDGVRAPAPFTLSPSLPASPAGPSLQGSMDDLWYGRIFFAAREAKAEVHDATGKLVGSYTWDLTGLSAAVDALNSVNWTCKPPVK